MGTVSESLGENCPCELLGNVSLGVLPGEGEKGLGEEVGRDGEKASLRSNTVKRVAVGGMADRRV